MVISMIDKQKARHLGASASPSPGSILTRSQTADALTAAGLPVAPATLATRATRGGGPPYRIFNGRALYLWQEVLDWAKAQTSEPRCSTSEADAQAGKAKDTSCAVAVAQRPASSDASTASTVLKQVGGT